MTPGLAELGAEEALGRVKRELLRSRLVDRPLVESLVVREARRRSVVVLETERHVVRRSGASAEEPLASMPTAPPVLLGAWGVAWPPHAQSELVPRVIDLRENYEVHVCPRCTASGRTPCGVCHGSTRVPDPHRPGAVRPCSFCHAQGTLVCGQCRGHGRVFRFVRVTQTVERARRRMQWPPSSDAPDGAPSGEVTIVVPLGFASSSDATAAVKREARALAEGPSSELARDVAAALAEPPPEGAYVGWLTAEVRWYDGWELRCDARGLACTYFVPDTEAAVIGPRLRSRRKIGALAAAGVGVVLSMGLGVHYAEVRAERARAEARSAEAERVRLAEAARLDAIRAELPKALGAIDAAVGAIAAFEASADAEKKRTELTELRDGLVRFDALVPAPQELVERRTKLDEAIAQVTRVKETIDAYQSATRHAQTGDERVKRAAWTDADGSYASAIQMWSVHPDLMRALKMDGKAVDPKLETEKLVQKRARIAPQVQREEAAREARRKKRQEEEAAQAAYKALCGERPVCSTWDGECLGIQRALKKVAHDPSSIDVENCSTPVLTDDHCWVTTCDVRGKNMFGAMIFERKRFGMSAVGVEELRSGD